MNIIDSILLLLVSLFALRGYFKGLFRESFSLLGLIVGLMSAVRYDELLAALLSEHWELPLVLFKAASFVGLFLAVYILCNVIGRLLHRFAKVFFPQAVNRVGGVMLGVGKGTAFLALVVLLLVSLPVMPQGAKRKVDGSFLVPPLCQLARELVRVGKTSLALGHDALAQEKEEAGSF